ncbi:hypothetical protein BH23CHL8_BH23CHL8_02870 [soil metagenome]
MGVHKAGTTWWWALLAAHPEIDVVPRGKELHILERLKGDVISDEQVAAYHRLFPRAPGHVCGEWTPRYMALPAMPRVIGRVAPEARLLAIVRDPVERYRSGLNQWREQTRRRSLKRPERAGKREALMRGFYGRQVQRLQEVVGPERFLVLQYERCVAQTQAEFDRTVGFLGVSPHQLAPSLLTRRFNATQGSKERISAAEEERLIGEYEPEVKLLTELVPDIDLDLWPRFAHLKGA